LSLLQATASGGGGGKFSPEKPAEVFGNVQAAAVFFPPTDFLNWGKTGVNVLDAPLLKPFLAAFDYEDLNPKTGRFEPVAEKDRVNEILKQTSPVYRITKESAPTLIVHGDKDVLVPIQQAEVFIDKLKEAGVPAELVVKKDGGHGWKDTPSDVERFADWFDKYLAPKM
jgi:acetyl esterase/lipase